MSLEQAKAMAVLLSLEGIQRRDSHPRAEIFSALGQPVLVHGARPARHQVQQPGRGMILPASGPRGQVLWSGVIVLCPSGWVMR